jgi:cyclopropane-fatty-acyl-phospholipid synthase
MVHCITGKNENGVNAWIDKYIFPGGYIPSVKQLVSDITEKNFYLIDMESLRIHYAMTLEHWARNFENEISEIEKMKDEHFIRMWRLYLNSCAASFKCGNIDIHQFLFTKGVNNQLPLTRNYMYK